jgi:formate/nitrite transporter FocA (FNT family)
MSGLDLSWENLSISVFDRLVPEKLSNIGLFGFLVKNLVPVTLGNIVGGGFFVATLYWIAYIRKGKKAA